MTLREIVHAHIPLMRANSTVRDAVDKMDIYQFPGLVFIDDDHKPIAVITEGDVVRAATRQDNLVSLSEHPALTYATKDPTCLGADTEIGEAFYRMAMSGLTLLPVTDAGRCIGVVLRVDLMQALILDSTTKETNP
jgi:CBS domain-containing protein